MFALATPEDASGLAEFLRVLGLFDHNTRMVVLTTTLLGAAAGLIGTFLLLRRRALATDALTHATLPGIAGAFIVFHVLGGVGRPLPWLLAGALVTGFLGLLAVGAIVRTTRLKEDAALGAVLSVTFGLGIVLLDIARGLPAGSAAGLETFIYGKTASIVQADLVLVAAASLLAVLVVAAARKELILLCFDEAWATTQGWPVRRLDALLLALVAVVATVGLQAVGLLLVIALFILPPAAARFWTDDVRRMLVISSVVGAAGGWSGSTMSALVPRLPAGAVIVLAGGVIFLVSLLFGPARGVLGRVVREQRLRRTVERQHLLRAMWERIESGAGETVTVAQLAAVRRWPRRGLSRAIGRQRRRGTVRPTPDGAWALTAAGRLEAAACTRTHRLWEQYLITHADVAPSHVDRGADQIEHVLGPELVAALERRLAEQSATGETGLASGSAGAVPPSPHPLRPEDGR